MKILAIGSHFDDIELGCGGSLLEFKKNKHEIFMFVATTSGYADPNGNIIRTDEVARNEGIEAAQFLEATLYEGNFPTFKIPQNEILNNVLKDIIEKINPDIIFTHWLKDSHQDHRIIAISTLHCARHIPKVLMYRSNWYESVDTFQGKFFKDITDSLEDKVTLVKIHHSEFQRTKGKWEKFIRAEAASNGLKASCEFAESFEVVKWVE